VQLLGEKYSQGKIYFLKLQCLLGNFFLILFVRVAPFAIAFSKSLSYLDVLNLDLSLFFLVSSHRSKGRNYSPYQVTLVELHLLIIEIFSEFSNISFLNILRETSTGTFQ